MDSVSWLGPYLVQLSIISRFYRSGFKVQISDLFGGALGFRLRAHRNPPVLGCGISRRTHKETLKKDGLRL